MDYPTALRRGTLLARRKRFLADVRLDNGDMVVAHCPNTGSMMGVADPGCPVWLLHQPGPTRRLDWTWELTELPDGTLAGVNTHRSNALVREALALGTIPALSGYARIQAETRYGVEGSRADFLLGGGPGPDCVLEVKNVTAAVSDGVAVFPDAVSARGTRHLRELAREAAAGRRAVLLFCVQRDDVVEVRPADAIDPLYGRTLREAVAAGLEVMAWGARPTPTAVRLARQLRFLAP